MTYAVQGFVEEKLGGKYVESRSVEFAKSFEESGPSTPVFFILSPGVNPLKVKFQSHQRLGQEMGKKIFIFFFRQLAFFNLTTLTTKLWDEIKEIKTNKTNLESQHKFKSSQRPKFEIEIF